MCIRYPPAPGGAETHVYSISKELRRRGHELKVFTSDLYKEIPFVRLEHYGSEHEGIPVKRFKTYSLGGELHYVFFPALIPSLLKEECDIMHAHSYGYFHVNLSAFIKGLRKIPFVLTPHFHPEWSMWGGEKRRRIRRIYDRVIAKHVLDSADAIIGVSRHEIELLKTIEFDESKVRIIPNGIEFSRFDPIPDASPFREKFNIDGQMILFTGRLATNKGLQILVKAMPDVLKEFPDTTFVLVGEDQGMKNRLKRIAEDLGVEKKLVFAGHITDENLFLSAYSACDVFVLPSEYEAFGIVLLEAMACQKPCIGTDVGGIPEVIVDGKSGIIVDYGDVHALANAITELLSDARKRDAFGRFGRERVKEKFTWAKVVEQIEDVYNESLLKKEEGVSVKKKRRG